MLYVPNPHPLGNQAVRASKHKTVEVDRDSFGDLPPQHIELVWKDRISACRVARDCNSPTTGHQTNVQRSLFGLII